MRRPIIRISLTKADKFTELTGLLILLSHWATCWWYQPDDSVSINSHTNTYHLVIISTTLFLAITILNRFPYAFNYLETITLKNAEQQYRLATRMVRFLKLICSFIFFFISLSMLYPESEQHDKLAIWLCLGVFVILLAANIYYLKRYSH